MCEATYLVDIRLSNRPRGNEFDYLFRVSTRHPQNVDQITGIYANALRVPCLNVTFVALSGQRHVLTTFEAFLQERRKEPQDQERHLRAEGAKILGSIQAAGL